MVVLGLSRKGPWRCRLSLEALPRVLHRYIYLTVRGDTGAIVTIAPYLFAATNIAIELIALGTLWLAVRGRLLPRSVVATTADGAS
jgi:hypothetical protein